MAENVLGRRAPSDWKHVEKYPIRMAAAPMAAPVERVLALPRYRAVYDQQREGACVGFASSWMMSILNRRRYAPRWLWNEAKQRDEWPDTLPGDTNGTSVRAAMDVLRELGHVRVLGGVERAPALVEGIAENRWARRVDEVRACIAQGVPVTIGVNWYVGFDTPELVGGLWRIGHTPQLGVQRGGHAVCVFGASDREQSVAIVNNWGTVYPIVWMPYDTLQRLLNEDGEATIVTDRTVEKPAVLHLPQPGTLARVAA